MYRPVGSCLLTGPKARIRRLPVRYWSYWNPASWHWKTIGSYVDPRSYVGKSAEATEAVVSPVSESLSETVIANQVVPDAKLLDAIEVTGTDAFPVLDSVLQHASVYASIGDCSNLLTGSLGYITYPALSGIDALHSSGLGWPLALFTIIIPVRMVATLIRQISMSKLAPVMFEANLAQTFNELKLDAFGASQNRYMLKHLGQRNAPKNAGLPQAYHEVCAFENYCDKHCGINFRRIGKSMNDRLLTHQMEQVLKTQVVSLLAFLYLNWTCRSFSQLPLDGIHDPLLFFSDPTMYEMTVLPICFSAIFTTKTLLTAHLQGNLNMGFLRANKWEIVGKNVVGPALLTHSLFWSMGTPGYTQSSFLIASFFNQAFLCTLETHKPTADYFDYKKQGEYEAELMKKLRENKEYAQLFDKKQAYENWDKFLIEDQKEPFLERFSTALRMVRYGSLNAQEAVDYIMTGDEKSSSKNILKLYPHKVPKRNDSRAADKANFSEKVEKQEEVYLADWRRQEGLRWSGSLKKKQDLDTRMIDELINLENEADENKKQNQKTGALSTMRVKKEDPWRNKKLKQKDFARKEDWEIFAENRDRKHDIIAKAPKPRGPWWETDRVNPNLN